jgi:hypothetical protein
MVKPTKPPTNTDSDMLDVPAIISNKAGAIVGRRSRICDRMKPAIKRREFLFEKERKKNRTNSKLTNVSNHKTNPEK